MSIVLDASMVLAWLFTEEHTRAAQEIMRNIALDGAIVPSLWHLEVANALHIAMRRKRCDEDYVDRSLERLTRLPIAVDYQTSDHAWGATKALARGHTLSLYDAAYLELALRLKKPLACCDAALLRAAKGRGVKTLSA